MATRMTSREFNQQTSLAKRAAAKGPVFITDRGRPSHVLLSYETYERLTGDVDIVAALAFPDGVGEIELEIPRDREPPRPAQFD